MCMLCVEIAKRSMTPKEIARAWVEMRENPHAQDVIEVLHRHDQAEEVYEEVREIVIGPLLREAQEILDDIENQRIIGEIDLDGMDEDEEEE